VKFAFGIAVFSSLLSVALSSNAGADSQRRTMHQRLSLDLNGDGRAEAIALKVGKDGNTFQLTVNGSTASGAMMDQITGFYIADINRADRFHEVVVYTPGRAMTMNTSFTRMMGRNSSASLIWNAGLITGGTARFW
jgi:hypothetical protein